LEATARYEVRLDRKLERMLAMLIRLRELRQLAAPTRGWSIAPFGYRPYDAFATTLLIVLPAALVLAWLSYTTIEAPFLSLRSRYIPLVGD
jgi:peptidoglycan/LPS O-acetylase OafA/YrhL